MAILKKLDIYILKRFLGTFVFSIVLIICIIIIFDISEKIDDFINAPLRAIIFEHYLNFVPYFINMLSPLFTFIAVIFFTSKMASRYETVAILSSGISYARFLRPYMIGAAMITGASLFSSHFIIPKATRIKQAFEDKYVNTGYQNRDQNIHRQVTKGTMVYLESYSTTDQTGYKFTIEKVKDFKLNYLLTADLVRWDSIKELWHVVNYCERFIDVRPEQASADSITLEDMKKKKSTIGNYKETLRFGKDKELKIDFTPKDLGRLESKVEIMTYPELKKFIAKEKEKGSSGIERFEVENYKRTSFPFATFILTLIGVAISSRKIRGGIGMHLALGLLLAASYVLFLHVSSIFAVNGMLSPFVAVWIPNVIYSLIAFYLLKTAQK
ncbi:MAG: LptF/LptG family permease [Bacteroidia bacterium]